MALFSSKIRIPLYNPRSVVNKTASYTVLKTDDQINVAPAAASTMTLYAISSLEGDLFKKKTHKIKVNSADKYIVNIASNAEDVIGLDEETSVSLPTVNGAQMILSTERLQTSSGKYMWVVEYLTETELKWSGNLTTVGGAAVETFTVPGATTSDLVNVTIQTSGVTPVTILTSYISAANTLSVTFSSNPSSDHVISIELYRVTV